MRIRLFMTIGACLALYGCNNNDAVNDQSTMISDSKITGSESRVASAASSETSQIKAVEKNIKSDELKSKKEVFIFTGDSVTSSQNSSRYFKIGERLPVSELRKRFVGDEVWSTAGEDCIFCAGVSGIEIHYDETGVIIKGIYCRDNKCADALGNAVGSNLSNAISDTATCDSGDEIYCLSPRINGLTYIVNWNENCVIQPTNQTQKIPSCSEIAGFSISK